MSRGFAPFDLATTPIESGITLIEASAGTGKTYCLTGLVLRLLLERHVDEVGQILVMTFTNAATSELVERVRATLRKAAALFAGEEPTGGEWIDDLRRRDDGRGLGILRRALHDLDDLGVCTIHGFCRRVLEESAFESAESFDVEYVDNDRPLLERAARDFWRRTLYPAGELVAAVAAHRGWTPEEYVKDYYEWRRQPAIVLEPTARPLEEAVARVEAAARQVRDAWDPDIVRRDITALRFEGKQRLSDEHLAALDDFCRRSRAADVGAALDMCAEKLRRRLTRKGKLEFVAFPFCEACDALAAAVDDLHHALRAAFLHGVGALFDREKHAARVAGFDDLLLRLHAALHDPRRAPALQRAAGDPFRAVLIDEFQDTDAIQYEIFRALFPRAKTFLIGDPKQAIYAFRGADVFAYLRANADADRAYTLDRNYRSETPLVEAVNAVFSRRKGAFVLEDISFSPVQPAGRADAKPLGGDGRRALEWTWLGRHTSKAAGTRAACAAVTAEISQLLSGATGARIADRPVEPRHVAVLVRTNDQAQHVQDALRTADVPAVVSQAGNVFESEEATELRTLLLAVLTPRDEGAVRAALASRTWGLDATAIAALDENEQRWQEVIDRLSELRALWVRKGFVAMAYALLAHLDARPRLLSSNGGERALTNLLHLVELAQQASVEQHLSPEGVVAWLAHAISDPKLQPAETAELRLESDADAVQIVTIHKSKGLEYDVAFCPFLWDARADCDPPFLVHLGDGGTVYHCSKPPDSARVDARKREQLAEHVRLTYVALTRAKHRCYATWGLVGQDESRNSGLAHVLDAEDPRAEIELLCAANATRMALRDGAAEAPPHAARTPATATELAARELPRRAYAQLFPQRVASFTSFSIDLTREDAHGTRLAAPAPAAAVASEQTPAAIGTASLAEAVVAPPAAELPDYRDPAEASADEDAAAAAMFAFARGTRAGTCLHEIFEHTDFADVRSAETDEAVAAALRRHGLASPAAHRGLTDPHAAVRGALHDLAESTPPGADFRLADVARSARLDEWQFYLPMARLSQSDLADCFARHGSGWIARDYPALLRGLGERTVEGFLTGFVDMVFTHDRHWYVVDWKSNHLGNAVEDYDTAGVTRAMRDHHYVLQYHLYTVALHRYLGRRLRDYDYDRDLGGSYYVFVRAVRPNRPFGWYFDRPPRALIEALDTTLAGAPRERR